MLQINHALTRVPSRDLLDLLPAAIYQTDAKGLITYYNEAASSLWGFEPELGKSEFCGSWKLYWPDGTFLPHHECPMALTLKEAKAHHGMEAVAERPDGSRVPFLAYPTPIFDDVGELIGAINMLVDISDRQRHEVDQERLAAIVNGSDDAIISKDLNGTITSWNRGAQRVFGYSTDEAVGRPVTMLFPEDHIDEEPQILSRIRQGKHVDHYETVRRRKDGNFINISLTVSPIRDARGRIVGASKIARDITDRKRQQEQQALLLREMRHRIKNTLTTVQSIATLTLSNVPDHQIEAFRSRLAALGRVHDILTSDNWGSTTLKAVVRQALEPFLDAFGSRIVVDCADVPITPDFAQTLALVLHELATNAVKYGALSNDNGKVLAKCVPGGNPTPLEWLEINGPAVSEPTKKGFGSQMLKRALIDHSTRLEYRPEGVFFSVLLPNPGQSNARDA